MHEKRPIYAREGVSYLWLVDPIDRTLEAFELHDGQWLLIASANKLQNPHIGAIPDTRVPWRSIIRCTRDTGERRSWSFPKE